MVKSLEKIDVFWDFFLEAFGEGFGRVLGGQKHRFSHLFRCFFEANFGRRFGKAKNRKKERPTETRHRFLGEGGKMCVARGRDREGVFRRSRPRLLKLSILGLTDIWPRL